MKIYPITSPRSGKAVANQFEIHTDDGVYFQSYQSIIAFVPAVGDGTKKTQLDSKYWDYSVTTNKYRNQFLGLNSKEIKAKIDSGEFELVNLN